MSLPSLRAHCDVTHRFDDAINTLRNCLKDDPNNVNAMRFLAITYGKLDRNASGADALLRRTPGTNRCLSRRLNARAGGDSLAITRAWV